MKQCLGRLKANQRSISGLRRILHPVSLETAVKIDAECCIQNPLILLGLEIEAESLCQIVLESPGKSEIFYS